MWSKELENPEAIRMFEEDPLLEGVTVAKLVLDQNGPTVTLGVTLRDYPSNPPAKWRSAGYDSVTIELQALAVSHVRLEGWTTDNEVSILIERRSEDTINIKVVGRMIAAEIACGWLRVSGLTPYKIEAMPRK